MYKSLDPNIPKSTCSIWIGVHKSNQNNTRTFIVQMSENLKLVRIYLKLGHIVFYAIEKIKLTRNIIFSIS